ncbi:MAG: glycoside hydrolase family 1 protein [Candidatus Omnitrophica bacterium]|nr:glycoside hydrolase family 1 protein [Candidatus Omnitrophota bacterium]
MKELLHFPTNFLWGAATSSHQVEGGNIYNDWWEWERKGRFKEASGRACNQYELFRNDFKLAKSLNHNAHRFSLEWSRIEPEKGSFDKVAINHYRDVIRSLRALGIRPIVTLNHFTLPVWFQKEGGWIGQGSDRIFAEYTDKVVRELGEDVQYWLTVNEPVGNIHGAYIDGAWPPGRRSLKDASRAFIAILRSHCRAYKVIHDTYRANNWPEPKVSLAKFSLAYSPCRNNSKLDLLSARIRHHYVNRLFIDALMKGWCVAPGIPITRLPLKRSLDFIGLNYYTRDFIHFSGFSKERIFGEVCSQAHHMDSGKRNFMKWEIYPEGLYSMLMEYHQRYGLPILITENGICTNDDFDRIDFIKLHLRQIHRAIKDGADIIGYLHWSLLDNFEWSHGYAPRFGLIEVDYNNQRRTIKPSARIYAEIIKSNAVDT